MANIWRYQKLEDEKLHYITESHPEDGIIGEHFFEYNQIGDLIEFCINKNLYFDNLELPFFGQVEGEEFFLAKNKLANIDLKCTVNIPMEGSHDKVYKTNYVMTLEMLEELPEEVLGSILKQLLEKLKDYIKNEEYRLEKR